MEPRIERLTTSSQVCLLNGDLTGQQKTANYHSTQVIITSFLSNFVFVPFCGQSLLTIID